MFFSAKGKLFMKIATPYIIPPCLEHTLHTHQEGLDLYQDIEEFRFRTELLL